MSIAATLYYETSCREICYRSNCQAPEISLSRVVYDVDPVFTHTEEWWQSIPEEVRPHKDQPFYHLLAENAETEYVAYVSEQNLMADTSGEPVRHPQVDEMLMRAGNGTYQIRPARLN